MTGGGEHRARLEKQCHKQTWRRAADEVAPLNDGRSRAGHRVHFEWGAGSTRGRERGAGRDDVGGKKVDQYDTLDVHPTM
jgi:hypothetical protein